MKEYRTRLATWNHGDPCDYNNGVPYHKLLGPCPICGRPTFDYGGGWRCTAMYCVNNSSNPSPTVGPEPEWWNTDIQVAKIDNLWQAYRESNPNIIGIGNYPMEAVQDLYANEQAHT